MKGGASSTIEVAAVPAAADASPLDGGRDQPRGVRALHAQSARVYVVHRLHQLREALQLRLGRRRAVDVRIVAILQRVLLQDVPQLPHLRQR